MPIATRKKPEFVATLAEVARAVGATEKQVRSFRLRKSKRGYNLESARRAHARAIEKNASESGLTDAAYRAARTAKIELERQRLKHEFDIQLGKYVLREDVEREWAAAARAFRDTLLRLPRDMAPVVVNKPVDQVASVLQRYVEQALRKLAKS